MSLQKIEQVKMRNEQSLTNIYNTMVSNNEIQRNIYQQTLVSELEKLKRKLEQKKALNVSCLLYTSDAADE